MTNHSDSTISLLFGNGDGTFQAHIDYSVGPANPSALTTADFNGDGNLDLAAVGYSSSVFLLLGDGFGNFAEPISFPATVTAESVTSGDFNADGNLDLAVSGESGVAVLLGDGKGSFGAETDFRKGVYESAIATGDFNQDGRLDFAVADEAFATVSVLLQQVKPVASLSPSSLTFGTQLVGTTSPQQQVTLTNTGNSALTIYSVVFTGSFQHRNECASTLGAGASCTISVAFKPQGAGKSTGLITVSDNATGSPHTVTLTGTGTVFELSAPGLIFGSVPVGQTSAPQAVTVTNLGKSSQAISGIRVSGRNQGEFTQVNNCGVSLAAGASCSITVTFTPKFGGTASAALQISGGGATQNVTLSGVGTN